MPLSLYGFSRSMLADKLLHPQSLVELENMVSLPRRQLFLFPGGWRLEKIGIYRELWHMLSL